MIETSKYSRATWGCSYSRIEVVAHIMGGILQHNWPPKSSKIMEYCVFNINAKYIVSPNKRDPSDDAQVLYNNNKIEWQTLVVPTTWYKQLVDWLQIQNDYTAYWVELWHRLPINVYLPTTTFTIAIPNLPHPGINAQPILGPPGKSLDITLSTS